MSSTIHEAEDVMLDKIARRGDSIDRDDLTLYHHIEYGEHDFGPVEYARMTGNPHRKCREPGCTVVSLDLDDDD